MMKRGSALLVVLGMLAFMVISAVAFSIFMRQGRLPSSFLRQRILARQLVKAGLAHAMSEIDAAIGNAKYPGLNENNDSADVTRNYWKNRVFMKCLEGFNGQYGAFFYTDESGDRRYQAYSAKDDEKGEPLNKTVSTMPFEGLAYVPPPLVNTVRYWSRHTPTAQWVPLDYDSGRYAYTAINVSDYLDINKVRANVMRDTSPSNRISLAFLFENDGHTDWGEVKPSKFDTTMDQLRQDGFGRLVSLADYNLALSPGGKLASSGFKSPFCDLVTGVTGDGTFYGSNADNARRQKFVTDSWHPDLAESASSGTSGSQTPATLYLTTLVGQPFDGKNESLDDLQKSGNAAFNIFCRHLDLCTLGALYDYVDEDNVPISLAIPTLEHAPMLTGIRLSPDGFEVTLDSSVKEVDGACGEKKKDTRTTWFVKSLGSDPKVIFSGCGALPFKRTAGDSLLAGPYKVEVMVKVFFSDQATFADTRSDVDWRQGATDAPDWSSRKGTALMANDRAFLTLYGTKDISLKSGVKSEDNTVFDVTGLELRPTDLNKLGTPHVYGLFRKYKLDEDTGLPVEDTVTYDSTDMTSPLLYRAGAKGDVKKLTDAINASGEGPQIFLNYVCWVRIVDGNQKTVDLVPAMISDDAVLNGHNQGQSPAYGMICGTRAPVLPICSEQILKVDLDTFKQSNGAQPTGVAQGSLAIYCDDPRYNYAPEDWYQSPDGDVRSSVWLAAAKGRCDGSNAQSIRVRQNDIFQFVANQGYLQSMGELQFLPYVTSFAEKSNPISGEFFSDKYGGKPFAERTDATQLANNKFAWATHVAFGDFADRREGEGPSGCDPYDWGIKDTNGGATVSPYAEKDLMMAALANTPYDYIVAVEQENAADKKLEDNIDLCFSEHQDSEAKLEWTKLEAIAEKIRAHMRAEEVEWDEWTDWDEEQFFGQTINDFHDVDRKFLFSYWKQCFGSGNEPQLFLIFVRAEPTVIGGDSGSHTPSQLGARAVALVWRESQTSLTPSGTEQNPPHKMRILFYHQFE